jgi:K+-sensing histidine kinase KdpD
MQRQAFGAQQSRLLCATDLTPRSERAVRAAALLANRLNARLTLMHVLAPSSGGHSETVHPQLDGRNGSAHGSAWHIHEHGENRG